MTTKVDNIDWREWKVTNEQVTKILNGDVSARNDFYFDNLDRIRRMARNYVYRKMHSPNGNEYNFEDCVNCVYVDIPMFRFSCGLDISRSVYYSFFYSIYGGLLYVFENTRKVLAKEYRGERMYILDKPIEYRSRSGDISDNGSLIIDRVASSPSPETMLLNCSSLSIETIENVVFKYLSNQEKEVFDDWLNGYEKHNIRERLGIKNISKQFDRIFAKLRANYFDILNQLFKFCDTLSPFLFEVPDDYEKSVKKVLSRKGAYSLMSEEQKAKAVERTRLWRQKKKEQRSKTA